MLAMQTIRTGARPFAGTKVSSAKNGTRVSMAKVGNWLPGSDTPAYLDALPASYGFGKSTGSFLSYFRPHRGESNIVGLHFTSWSLSARDDRLHELICNRINDFCAFFCA